MIGFVVIVIGIATVPRCKRSGCNEIVDKDNTYCSKCEHEIEKEFDFYHNSLSKVSTKNLKNNKQSSSTSTNNKNSASSKNHSNSYMHDPDDYDSAEDFADDAYGYDFDDWDDAYDYWENY